MPLSRPPFLLLAAGAAMFCACAKVPTEMRLHPSEESAAVSRVWPSSPEQPRYRYAGELTGEPNFGPVAGIEPSTAEKLFRWVVGLGSRRRGAKVLVRPQNGVVDEEGRIYVTDVGRRAVFAFDQKAGKLQIWEYADQFSSFISPIGIAIGKDGEVLVADSGLARIVRLNREGRPLGSIGKGELLRPTGLARDSATGHLFVSDTAAHDIKVFDDAGRLVKQIGRRGTDPGEFNAPTFLSFAGGKLYVSDTLNARVQVIDADGPPITLIGRRGLYVGNLTRPKGVAVDADGNVYVVESYYDYLLIFDAAGRFLLPIGGTGTAVGQFFLPTGIWTDAQGRVFIADMFNGRVLILQYMGGGA